MWEIHGSPETSHIILRRKKTGKAAATVTASAASGGESQGENSTSGTGSDYVGVHVYFR